MARSSGKFWPESGPASFEPQIYADRLQRETSGIIAAGFMLLLAATPRQHWRRRVLPRAELWCIVRAIKNERPG